MWVSRGENYINRRAISSYASSYKNIRELLPRSEFFHEKPKISRVATKFSAKSQHPGAIGAPKPHRNTYLKLIHSVYLKNEVKIRSGGGDIEETGFSPCHGGTGFSISGQVPLFMAVSAGHKNLCSSVSKGSNWVVPRHGRGWLWLVWERDCPKVAVAAAACGPGPGRVRSRPPVVTIEKQSQFMPRNITFQTELEKVQNCRNGSGYSNSRGPRGRGAGHMKSTRNFCVIYRSK